MTEGPLAALDAIEKATGEREVNVIGYCLGGTLLARHARLSGGEEGQADRERDLHRRCSTSPQPGELEVFIDEAQVARLEKQDERARLPRRLARWRRRSTCCAPTT